MKRSGPPKRKTEMKRTGKRPKPVSARRRRLDDTHRPVLREALLKRSGGRCEMVGAHAPGCNGQGHDPAHIIPRTILGSDKHPLWYAVENHYWLSRQCHTWCEEHPAEANELGMNGGSAELREWEINHDYVR